jgi:hypothetical protein
MIHDRVAYETEWTKTANAIETYCKEFLNVELSWINPRPLRK